MGSRKAYEEEKEAEKFGVWGNHHLRAVERPLFAVVMKQMENQDPEEKARDPVDIKKHNKVTS